MIDDKNSPHNDSSKKDVPKNPSIPNIQDSLKLITESDNRPNNNED